MYTCLKLKYALLFLLINIMIFITTNGFSQIIDTVLGNGEKGYNGDEIPGKKASLSEPMSVCADEMGNVYVADTKNNRIRMVDPSGVVHTIGGTGIYGHTGDSQKAIKAFLAYPMGVHAETIDKEKGRVRIYIADTQNNKIRMINEFGIIQTIAGTGRYGRSGDRGPALQADLAWPSEVSMDKYGNLYIADTYNNQIRAVYNPNNSSHPGPLAGAPHIKNLKNRHIYTIAGTGAYGYCGDGKTALVANLKHPWDVSVADENLFFSDRDNHIIRRVDKNGIITAIAGLPAIPGYYGDVLKATEEKLNIPFGLWADGDKVYVADGANFRIREINTALNKISTIAGCFKFGFAGEGIPAKDSRLSHPVDIFGDGKGNLYICDLDNSRVRVIKNRSDKSGKIIGKAE